MDPIADMLTTIKNGYLARKAQVSIPVSKYKLALAKVLEKEGFIGKVEQSGSKIDIGLLYIDKKPRVTQIRKTSKLGRRVYLKSKNISSIKGGKGILIISTPQGAMTGKDAKTKKLGGEVICQVW